MEQIKGETEAQTEMPAEAQTEAPKALFNQAGLPTVEALAYLGDAVHALHVRQMLVRAGGCRSGELNKKALGHITASSQAKLVARILPYFEEEEKAVYQRAFNHKHLRIPKHATGKEYRMATGFEAVLGMLFFLGRSARINELLAHQERNADETLRES